MQISREESIKFSALVTTSSTKQLNNEGWDTFSILKLGFIMLQTNQDKESTLSAKNLRNSSIMLC